MSADVAGEVVNGDGYAVGHIVHRGRIQMEFGDGSRHVLGPCGLARVDAPTVRRVKNVGEEDAIYVIVGGKDGYVGRDGVPG